MRKVDFRSQNGFEQITALVLIALGVVFRVLPHPDNFTPVTAIAVFSGVTLSPALAFTVPLIVMMASDLLIGPHPLFWLVWATFVLVTWLGQAVRAKNDLLPVAFATLGGSALFFVLTNLGVFLFQDMYPKSAAGLVECFALALPFFRNSLAGDFFYTAVLFLIFELARRGARAVRQN